jgi:hypothetical protein
MKHLTTTLHHFHNFGFLSHKFNEDQLIPIRKEIDEIQSSFDSESNVKANHYLAGNLKREFQIKNQKYVEDLVKPYIKEYRNANNEPNDKNIDYKLENVWVNFQQKHEFNPVHAHGGIYSFVIWIKIPFYIQDELEASSGKYSNSNFPGHFQFIYTTTIGSISNHAIPVDKSMENSLIVFPASMFHTVYPFYTSDEYRISLSGNFIEQLI